MSWFQNDQYDSFKCVLINNTDSDYHNVNCNVPQGSLLGPLLFIVYINDLQKWFQNSKVVLYAGDSLLLYAHGDVNIINSALEEDIKCASK